MKVVIPTSAVIVLVLVVSIPMILSILSGLFGGVEGFECWCRSDTGSFAQTAQQPAGTAAIVVAPYSQWAGVSSGFPDPRASIIWNTANAQTSAPVNATSVNFSKAYYNATGAAQSVTVHVLCDDTASISLNGTSVGTVNWGTYAKLPATFTTGNNVITAAAKNAGNAPNPAGLMLTVTDSTGKVLFSTDATWTWV